MLKRIIVTFLMLIIGNSIESKTVLVFGGATGWIGKKFVTILKEQGHYPVAAVSRLENRESIEKEIAQVRPDYIINTAGLTGKPNVDWCEDHRPETIRTNVIGTLNLVDISFQHNIHVTNVSTGCIYEYDDKHPMGSGIGFIEEEDPNFTGSFYSRSKIVMERLLLEYPNVLNLRVKMPISEELNVGFIGKITKYEKVVNIPNSFTILDELLPIAVDMTLRGIKGNYNFVNPGTLSHNQILDLYKKYINPNFTYQNFSVEEQDKILKARRANAELSAKKLLDLYPNILSAKDSLESLLKRVAAFNKSRAL